MYNESRAKILQHALGNCTSGFAQRARYLSANDLTAGWGMISSGRRQFPQPGTIVAERDVNAQRGCRASSAAAETTVVMTRSVAMRQRRRNCAALGTAAELVGYAAQFYAVWHRVEAGARAYFRLAGLALDSWLQASSAAPVFLQVRSASWLCLLLLGGPLVSLIEFTRRAARH